jgi:hypothetical protein
VHQREYPIEQFAVNPLFDEQAVVVHDANSTERDRSVVRFARAPSATNSGRCDKKWKYT